MSSGIVALALLAAHCSEAFVPSTPRLPSNALETNQIVPSVMGVAVRKKETQLDMFMGSDGGILGVGTPEIVRINIVHNCHKFSLPTIFLTHVCSSKRNDTISYS